MLKAMFPLIPMENVEYLLWIHFLRLQKSKGTGVHAVTQIFFFLKNLFIYFNWRTVTSQHSGGPCHTQHGSTRCLVFVPHCGSPQNSAPFNPAEEKRIVYTQKISHLFICIFITQIVFPFSALFLDCSSVIW